MDKIYDKVLKCIQQYSIDEMTSDSWKCTNDAISYHTVLRSVLLSVCEELLTDRSSDAKIQLHALNAKNLLSVDYAELAQQVKDNTDHAYTKEQIEALIEGLNLTFELKLKSAINEFSSLYKYYLTKGQK